MGRILSNSTGVFSYEVEGITVPMNTDTYFANLFRHEPFMDQILLEDPRDNLYWRWFRCDTKPDEFRSMLDVAYKVGHIVILDKAPVAVSNAFDQVHSLSEDDILKLLDYET